MHNNIICSKCGIKKSIDNFYLRKNQNIRNPCKSCILHINKQWKEKNYAKALELTREWTKNNKKRKTKIDKLYRDKNKEKKAKTDKLYRNENREKINNFKKEKRKNNIHYRLSCSLRTRISKIVTGEYKSGSAIRDLGCSVEDLKIWLESKFQLGMSWKNYGFYGWHIDHVKSLSSFNLTKRKQFLEACHYTNLQPLWAFDNLSKGNKI